MIQISSNVHTVVQIISDKLSAIDIKVMTRDQASTLMAAMRKRVHVQGLASNGQSIGNYSKPYLAVRSGQFKNSPKATKGKNKGKATNAGVTTKSGKDGKGGTRRINYNRGSDPKVILSLTRQMESDMILIPLANGCAIGYSNAFNLKKAQWAEKRYKKKIFDATDKEREQIDEIAGMHIKEKLK